MRSDSMSRSASAEVNTASGYGGSASHEGEQQADEKPECVEERIAEQNPVPGLDAQDAAPLPVGAQQLTVTEADALRATRRSRCEEHHPGVFGNEPRDARVDLAAVLVGRAVP